MGWDIGAAGLTIVLDAQVPALVEQYLGTDIRGLLADHDLDVADVAHWVSHPGGPKVIEAIEKELELPRDALELTWRSLAEVGNLSSVSVLHVLRDTLVKRSPVSGHAGNAAGDGARVLFRTRVVALVTAMSDGWYICLIALVGVERLVELVVSKRNIAWSLANGGREFGAGHYPAMVALHSRTAGRGRRRSDRRRSPLPTLVGLADAGDCHCRTVLAVVVHHARSGAAGTPGSWSFHRCRWCVAARTAGSGIRTT